MNKERIYEITKKTSGYTIDLCYEIITEIEELSFAEQVEIVSSFCEIFGTVKSEETIEIPRHISDERFSDLKELYARYVNEMLETTLKKAYSLGMNIDSFYELLWGNVIKSDMFCEIEEKSFALYYIVIDRRIPYFQLEKGLRMEEDEFEKYRDRNIEILKKIRFVLSNSFGQKTEEASIILQELMGLDSYEDRVVVLTWVLDLLRQEQKLFYDAMREANHIKE